MSSIPFSSLSPLTAQDQLRLRRVAAQVLPRILPLLADDLDAIAVAYNCAALFLSLRKADSSLSHPCQLLDRVSLEELAQLSSLCREEEWGFNQSFGREQP